MNEKVSATLGLYTGKQASHCLGAGFQLGITGYFFHFITSVSYEPASRYFYGWDISRLFHFLTLPYCTLQPEKVI